MSSRERRLLDKDIEIRKLQGELKHYKTCFFSCVFEKDRIRKALEIAKDTLHWYDNNYDSVVARNTLDEIETALGQKDVK